jgi:hypothetical protein
MSVISTSSVGSKIDCEKSIVSSRGPSTRRERLN